MSSAASGSAPALMAAARMESASTLSLYLAAKASALSARSLAALTCLSRSVRRRSVRRLMTSSSLPSAISFVSSSWPALASRPLTASRSKPSN
ncbi:hypothetical protein D3C78_1634820 [compost metagenome]